MIEAVRQNGYALQFAAPELQGDRRIVIAAVKQNGLALKHAAPEHKADREVVLFAVRQKVLARPYAAQGLRDDSEIVLEAVRQQGSELGADDEQPAAPGDGCRTLGDGKKKSKEK